VTVEATSPSLQGTRSVVTREDGNYRFPAVAPGIYRVRATLSPLASAEKVAAVSLDATATVDMMLALTAREEVAVSGGIPLVDVTSTTSGTNYTSNVIARLPVARNYADIVRSNPGVNTDRGETQGRSLALTFYGATSVENQWIIDGINTTNVLKGIQGKAINNEFVEEVEVKTGGYQAEYGRALGGIVNVITKSGGNRFRGDVFAYFDSNETKASRTVTPEDELSGMRITPTRRWDYGADLGGYIFKDRLWFFAAYNQIDSPGTTSRYTSTPAVPNTLLFPRDQTDNLYSGKLTWNIANRSTLVATGFSDPSVTSGARGGVFNPDPGTWESRREIGATDFGLRLNQLLSSSGVLVAQASRHRDRFELLASGAGAAIRSWDGTCPGGTPSSPCHRSGPWFVTGGLGSILGPFDRNRSERDQYRADTTFYLGNHEVKFGGDYEDGRTTTITYYTGGQEVALQNEYGQVYYSHDFIARSPTDLTPVDQILEARAIDTGFFVQDSWRVASGLTVNAGLRWDAEDMRNYSDQTVLKTSNEWQPRLGIVWDPTGAGRMKVYASAGRFYYSLPNTLSIFAHSTTASMTTFNFDPLDTTQDPRVIGHEHALISVSSTAEPVDEGIKGTYQDELTVGVEGLIAPSFSFGLKGTYRRIGRMIEDRCDLDYRAPENRGSSCAIVNPGSNGRYARGDFTGCNRLDGAFRECTYGAEPAPPARRVYRGIELLARKAFGEKLWLQSSYVYSSLRGNIDGGVNQDTGQTTPGIAPDFDVPAFWHNAYGRLYLDRPHAFRLDASYTTPWKVFVGLQGFVESGAPLNQIGYFCCRSAIIINLAQRGYAGRMPTLWEANLTLGYPVVLGPVTVTAQAYVFNLFNNQIRTRQEVKYTTAPPPGYPATIYDPEVPPDRVNPQYGKTLSRQEPRLFRAALRISF
jgi:hypothetical protein